MPSHELLGPLQISLGRMIGDIARFGIIFLLVLISFMVGMTNLYRYYGSHIDDDTHEPASESFKGFSQTVHTLFFAIFGLIPLDRLRIKSNQNDTDESTVLVHRVGEFLYAFYLVVVSIVLVNILIAMMSHSFDDVQGDNDVEWKFARTKLWLNYIDDLGTLPVPFNMIPTPKNVWRSCLFIASFLYDEDDHDDGLTDYDYQRRRRNISVPEMEAIHRMLDGKSSTYVDIIQRLVRRYLFRLERNKREDHEFVNGVGNNALDAFDDDDAGADLPTNQRQNTYNRSISVGCSYEISRTKTTNIGKADFQRQEIVHPILKESSPILQDQESNKSNEPRLIRSKSEEAVRHLTRRATIKRNGTRQMSRKRVISSTSEPEAPFEAILRSQRVLDARLQDLQNTRSVEGYLSEKVAKLEQNVESVLESACQQARVMDSFQDEIRNLAIAVLGSQRPGQRGFAANRYKTQRARLQKKRCASNLP